MNSLSLQKKKKKKATRDAQVPESKCIGNPRISAAGKKSEPYTQILYKKVCGLRFPILTQQKQRATTAIAEHCPPANLSEHKGYVD